MPSNEKTFPLSNGKAKKLSSALYKRLWKGVFSLKENFLRYKKERNDKILLIKSTLDHS
jgi:hypothetical protein